MSLTIPRPGSPEAIVQELAALVSGHQHDRDRPRETVLEIVRCLLEAGVATDTDLRAVEQCVESQLQALRS